METTEKIVEAYVRYVKGWATIPNIKCPGQNEIDLLAVNPKTGRKYHIEVTVSITSGFSKITTKKFDPILLKKRVHTAGQRRTLGFFVKKKFSAPGILETLQNHGFKKGKYKKIIVSWGWTPEAEAAAKKFKIILWRFPDILDEIAENFKNDKKYFADDTLRTLQLYAKATKGVK